MKIIRHAQFGEPAEVLACIEVDDPAPPEPGEIAVDMLAMPINPADLLRVEGRYGEQPELPATPGFEGVGRVGAVGQGVETPAVGDLVAPLFGPTWVARLVCSAKAVMPLPAGIDVDQAAMVKANPASAWALLDRAQLAAGDRLIQNAANSAVGRTVARLAAARGIKTVNIVRRPEAAAAFDGLTGAHTLVCDPEDAETIATAGPATVAFDAVAGEATAALAGAVAEGGLVVNYGLLSGAPCRVGASDLIFRDVRVEGFWLKRWVESTKRATVMRMYAELIAATAAGDLYTPVAARYTLDRIGEAVRHAASAGRAGKILLHAGGDAAS